MKVLSWRGPRGWSRWHLVSTSPGDQTLCKLEVPLFAPFLLHGPTDPQDELVCLSCRERYGMSSAVSTTLALIDTYQPQPPLTRWSRAWPWIARIGIALSPMVAVLLFDFFVTPPLFTLGTPAQDIALGLSASGINGGIIAVLVRRIARLTSG
jgi:hypothetical protein